MFMWQEIIHKNNQSISLKIQILQWYQAIKNHVQLLWVKVIINIKCNKWWMTEYPSRHTTTSCVYWVRSCICKVTVGNTLDSLKTFDSFLYRNFYGEYEHYEKTLPKLNQPGQLYGTAKTHKFNSIEDITLENLKVHPIIAGSSTYTYNPA